MDVTHCSCVSIIEFKQVPDGSDTPVQFARFAQVLEDWEKQNLQKGINNGNMRGMNKLPMASS